MKKPLSIKKPNLSEEEREFVEGESQGQPEKVAQKPNVKAENKDDIRFNCNMPKELHFRLKLDAVKRRMSMSEIVLDLLEKHIP